MKKTTYLTLILLTTLFTQGQNKLLSSIYEDYENNTWSKSRGNNYLYDNNNNLISDSSLEYDADSNTWTVTDKKIYSYNSSNKMTEKIEQSSANSLTNTLENSVKETNTYVAGRPTETVNYEWVKKKWAITSKYTYTYNANNILVEVFIYTWNGSSYNLENKLTQTYNANNKLVSQVSEILDGETWLNYYRNLYTYDLNNKLLNNKGAEYNEDAKIWEQDQLTEYVVNTTGNRISETTIEGDSRSKIVYAYSTTELMSAFTHPFKDKTGIEYIDKDFPYISKVNGITEYTYNNQTKNFEQFARTTYNYNSAITLGANALEKQVEMINVYPNPTADFLTVKSESNTAIDNAVITDTTGKVLLTQNINTNKIDVQSLSKGLYLLQLSTGDKKETKKFIKR
jgi:hypothetical protein